jgi:spore germination protein YaaH
MCLPLRPILALLALSLPAAAAGCQRTAGSAPRAAEVWAFTGPWEKASDASVRANARRLSAVVTGWITLDSATGRPILPSPFPDTVARGSRTGTARMAIVTSWHGDRFHARTIRRLAADRALLARTAGAVAAEGARLGYAGLVLDFETLEPADLPAQLAVVRAIRDSAHARGVRPVAVAIPALDTAAYPAARLLGVADLVLVMLYDQHWLGSEPGPVAAPAWVRQALALRVREAGAARVVAALPLYGYRWRRGAPTEIVTYAGARRIAAAERVPLARDAGTATLRAAKAGAWEMWVTDARLVAALVREGEALGVRRFALWRLGQEDPAVWSALPAPR